MVSPLLGRFLVSFNLQSAVCGLQSAVCKCHTPQKSDHFPQFLIIEDLKLNYATLNYYKHDCSHFSEDAFVDEVPHLDFSPIYNVI